MADPWITPEELRAHLRLPTIDAEAAGEVIAAAQATIRAETDQHLDLVADAEVELTGAGAAVLVLPERPITAVTTVTVDGAVLDPADYRWARHGILTHLTGVWPLDSAVTVVCTHGWNPIPEAVRLVCRQIAGRAYLAPPAAGGSGLYQAESLGDRSVTYARDSAGNPITGQAPTEYERVLLAPYARGPRSR
ncbi:hypothetical protein FH609_011685 [Streptomyces sp. 3MP-14]|uniref:Phage gp6-like head-tail connector protein n=1 Tax=Streptomyces mimosae TaxID=2586635 RepID=A0A5N6AE02_9ACTN|nr:MULTISPECIES: hypothetical protein [Streptomyces]KAB8167057.1 hypothetical protein FH607_009135 [Streptomyces mimosae]KAB8176998.1 hypothetical protein FH609_011685 [Streptomyces sp. 3MP-14]